jgi:hypothetical protein
MNNFVKWILHSVVTALLLGVPVLLNVHPAWLDMTFGGALAGLYQWLVATQASPYGVAFRKKDY